CVQVSFCAGVMFHTVTVSDDGSGFCLSSVPGDHLGLRIVEATVRDKLRGKLHICSDSSGTRMSFDFKNEIM
ncbi:MAG: histidine kinase, partial [Lawsonibacter sp.]|nr:histidine kinase [Lawsonibacter sp.]